LSGDRSWPGRSPRLSPAPQCKPCWRLWRETKVRNAKLIGLNEISRSSSLCSWPGLRSEELRLADIGDIRTTDNRAATIHVRGKGGKERSVPIEAELLSVIEACLDSRAIRFPGGTKRKAGNSTSALSRWPARSPLFVGRDGERITRGTLQSRIERSFKRAGPEAQPLPGAFVHGLRHTYATELAGADVSVYALMNWAHESMTTSQPTSLARVPRLEAPQRETARTRLSLAVQTMRDLEIWLDRDS
jgi:integrase